MMIFNKCLSAVNVKITQKIGTFVNSPEFQLITKVILTKSVLNS